MPIGEKWRGKSHSYSVWRGQKYDKNNLALLEWAIHLILQNLSYPNIQLVVVVVCACLWFFFYMFKCVLCLFDCVRVFLCLCVSACVFVKSYWIEHCAQLSCFVIFCSLHTLKIWLYPLHFSPMGVNLEAQNWSYHIVSCASKTEHIIMYAHNPWPMAHGCQPRPLESVDDYPGPRSSVNADQDP